MKEKEYLLKLLNENMDFHNRNMVMRTILEKHGLMEEVSELGKDWNIDKPCPCEDGIDAKACVGCEYSEDGKREYKPYVTVDEFIQDFQERFPTAVPRPAYTKPLIWVRLKSDGRERLIVAFGKGFGTDFVEISNKAKPVFLQKLFDDYEFLDGTPCGMEVKDD